MRGSPDVGVKVRMPHWMRYRSFLTGPGCHISLPQRAATFEVAFGCRTKVVLGLTLSLREVDFLEDSSRLAVVQLSLSNEMAEFDRLGGVHGDCKLDVMGEGYFAPLLQPTAAAEEQVVERDCIRGRNT